MKESLINETSRCGKHGESRSFSLSFEAKGNYFPFLECDFMNAKRRFQCEPSCLLYVHETLAGLLLLFSLSDLLRGGQTNIFVSSSFYKTFKLIFYPFLNTEERVRETGVDVDRTLIFILTMEKRSEKSGSKRRKKIKSLAWGRFFARAGGSSFSTLHLRAVSFTFACILNVFSISLWIFLRDVTKSHPAAMEKKSLKWKTILRSLVKNVISNYVGKGGRGGGRGCRPLPLSLTSEQSTLNFWPFYAFFTAKHQQQANK